MDVKSIKTFNAACRSIKVDYVYDDSVSLKSNLVRMSNSFGYCSNRGSSDWIRRAKSWIRRTKDCSFLYMDTEGDISILTSEKDKKLAVKEQEEYIFSECEFREENMPIILPFWPSQGDITLDYTTKLVTPNTPKKIQTIKESKPMKSLFDSMLDSNKDAATLAAQVTAGKAANDLIQSKLYASLPWYARFFAKKKDAKNNGLAKLAVANIVVGLSQHFAKGDPKLKYISEAMLQDAMVTLTRDSEMLEKFVAEITDVVKVPNEILEQFNKQQ